MKSDEETDKTEGEKDEVIEKTGFQCGSLRDMDDRQKKKQSFLTGEAAIPKDLPFFLKEKMLESS